MTLFQTVTVLIVLTALGGYLNRRALSFPPTIGLMAIALVSSLMLVFLGKTGIVEIQRYARFVPSIEFSDLVFHGFLAFLLFAGALHVDLEDLYKVKWTVTILSTFGTILSTVVVGALFWSASHALGYDLRFIYALLFGALISPTDPIAVLGIIKTSSAYDGDSDAARQLRGAFMMPRHIALRQCLIERWSKEPRDTARNQCRRHQ